MKIRLQNQEKMNRNYAIITGATSGIGRELCNFFIDDYNLIIIARNEENLNLVKNELSHKKNVVVPISVDLTNLEELKTLKVEFEKYPVKLLINNAGVGFVKDFESCDYEKIQQCVRLNIDALTSLTHLMLQTLIKNEGEIINIASTAGYFPGPFMAVYHATKSYVISFSKALAYELIPKNIKVSCYCPPLTDTNFLSNSGLKNTKLFKGKKPLKASLVAKKIYKTHNKKSIIKFISFKDWFVYNFLITFIPQKLLFKIVSTSYKSKI
jgi:short-subunit dehydrogenase